jgi:hypothetical protein
MQNLDLRITEPGACSCPHFNVDFSGYCEGCGERTDCLMKTILRKLQSLESMIADIKSC